jgi:integrase
MGRRRKIDKHLPQRMYERRGAYYFVDKSGRWLPLGRDYALAMAEYGRLSGPSTPCSTMQHVVDRYRIHVLPQKAASTQKDQAVELTRLASVFGLMRPDEITTQHVYQYLDERSATPTAARHEVSLLHHLFKKAIRWGAGTKNPASGVEMPKTSPRDRYVKDNEFEAVYELAGASTKVAMHFALLTGLRLGDILRLNRDSLLDQGMFVPTSKTGKGLSFEYTDELHRAIKSSRELKPQLPGYYLI